MTERDLLDALWARLTTPINGLTPRYAMAEHVRSHPGAGANCSVADAIAVDCWGSGRYELEGYEVKVTRSDWRRELTDDLAKSATWRAYCTRWYMLAPTGVIPRDQLPDGWGLIEHHLRAGLRCVVPSARFDTEPLPPRVIASLMRSTAATAARHAAPRPPVPVTARSPFTVPTEV